MPIFSRSNAEQNLRVRVVNGEVSKVEKSAASTDLSGYQSMQNVNGLYRYPEDAHNHGREAMHIFFNTQEERIKGTCANFLKRWGIHVWEDTNYFRDPSQCEHAALYAGCNKLPYKFDHVLNDPQLRSRHINPEQLFSSFWYGHATNFLSVPLKGAPRNVRIMTDPVEGHLNPFLYPRRTRPSSEFNAIDLENLDICLISHNHRDHVDDATLKKLAAVNPNILMIIPKDVTSLMQSYGFTNIVELEWWEKQSLSLEIGGQLYPFSIDAVPAKHWSGRTPFDGHKTGFNGYVIQSSAMDGDLYFAGDTALMSNSDEVPHRQMLSERYNICYSLQPGGPDEVRRYMETTKQSSADALLMHFDFALARKKKNPGESLSQSVGAITTVFMHTKTFKLGNLHIDDTDTSLARVILALKDTGKKFSLARVNLKSHEVEVLTALVALKSEHSVTDDEWQAAIVALEKQVIMPKIGETTFLNLTQMLGTTQAVNAQDCAGVVAPLERETAASSTIGQVVQSPIRISFRDVCTNYRALRHFDAITRLQIADSRITQHHAASDAKRSLLDDDTDQHSQFAKNLILHLLGDYQNKILGRLTRHHRQRASCLAAQIRTAHTLDEIRDALREHSNITGVSYRQDGHYMTLLNYAHWVCDCEEVLSIAKESSRVFEADQALQYDTAYQVQLPALAPHALIETGLLAPQFQSRTDWGYRIAAPLAVPALMLLLGLTKIAYAAAKHPSFVVGTAVAAAALAVMHKMIPMLFATLPMMLGMVAGGVVVAALIGFSIKGLAQLFPNAASKQPEHAAAAPAAEVVPGM